MAVASVRTDIVLARPGTPSSRTWPLASRPTSRRSTSCSWPTITRPTSARNARIQVDVSATCSFNGLLIAAEFTEWNSRTQAPSQAERGQLARVNHHSRTSRPRSVGSFQRPFDAAEQMRLIGLADLYGVFAVFQIRVSINHVFAVTQRCVEHAALAVIFAPGNAIMTGGTAFGMLVHDQQVVDFRLVIIFELINLLLLDRPGFR